MPKHTDEMDSFKKVPKPQFKTEQEKDEYWQKELDKFTEADKSIPKKSFWQRINKFFSK
jgi:hypothetical protein